jgi:GDP-mannose 6-dehydrogenase
MSDTKLNISPVYLKPGFAFGGSCLPKDLRAINRLASLASVEMPMINAIRHSNELQIERVVKGILARKPRSVGMVGLAFKKNTDDMRESPYVTIAKRLFGEGISLKIYDPFIHPDRLIGSNKISIQNSLNHLEKLIISSLDELEGCDYIIINHAIVSADKIRHWIERKIHVLDLADVGWQDKVTDHYDGISW